MSCFKREYTIPSWSIKPNITVLLPVFNQSKFLRNSVESILVQTDIASWGGKLKIKVLNDGSVEPIQPIIQDLIDAKLIDYKERTNAGLPLALNELYRWELTDPNSSDFITWHSADNLYLPESLFKMTSFLIANPDLDFTFANVQLINERGEPFYSSNYRVIDQLPQDSSLLNLNYPTELLSQFSDNFVNACFLEKRASCRLIPPYNPKYNGFEDYVHWINMTLLGKGEHFGEIKSLYQYRLHEESLTSILESDLLVSGQKRYLKMAQEQQTQVNNEIYQLSDKTLVQGQTKATVGCFLSEIETHLHVPHSEFQKLSSKIHRNPYGLECFIPGAYEVPDVLKRARGKYLRLFGSDFEDTGRVVIFAPEDLTHVKDTLLNFIIKNKHLGIILYSASHKSRAVADSLYIESNLARNLRIVDAREISLQEESHVPLLNALGSSDAVISISSFHKKLNGELTAHPYLLNDFCAEACLAASAGRPLLAPRILPINLTGPLPHLFPWDSENSLPNNLAQLKTDLTSAHYDAILRTFSQSNIRNKQVHALIFSSN